MTNYNPIKRLTDELLYKYYQNIEKDLEKIINAPSLLARLSKYYHLAQDTETDTNVLIFVYDGNVSIVREWNIDKFILDYNLEKRIKYWCDSGLSIIPPKAIMFNDDGLQNKELFK